MYFRVPEEKAGLRTVSSLLGIRKSRVFKAPDTALPALHVNAKYD
jgi:hypothetical protein